jgi:hypothetical protein
VIPKYIIRVRVPNDKINDLRLPPVFDKLAAQLEQESEIELVCVHEAGHLYYSRRMGLEPYFAGPTVYHEVDEDGEHFDSFPAAVLNPELNTSYRYNEERINGIARIAVAGGEFVQRFLPGKPRGDGGDYTTFSKRCYGAMTQGYQYEIGPRWRTAQAEVKLEIETLDFEKDVRPLMEEVRCKSFEANRVRMF